MKEGRLIRLAVPLLVAVWLQGYLFSVWRPLGVVPNLLIIIVMFSGLALTASETVAVAILGGLLLDLLSGTDFGLRMGFYSVLALAVLVSRRAGADYDNLGIVMLVTVVGTLVYNMGVLVGLNEGLVGLSWSFVAGLVIREAILNLVLALVARPIMSKLYRAPVSGAVR